MTTPAEMITLAHGLRFQSSPWMLGVSIALVLLVAAVSAAGWWRSGFKPGFGLLEGLRLLIALLVAILLNQPEWVTQQRPVDKPTIAVLLDDSQSMETVDVRRGDSRDGGESPGALSRAEAVAALGERSFWSPLEDRYAIAIEPFSSAQAVDAKAVATGTNLFDPLDAAVRRYPNLRGVVITSDGDWNEGKPPVQAATSLRLAGVPVFAVPVGSLTPLPDVAVSGVESAVTGVVAKPFRVPFTIRSSLPREQMVTVEIEASDGQRFTKEVRLASMQSTIDWILWTPATVGDYTLTVRVPPQAGELLPDNNARSVPVAIREEKLRVLIVESVPRWEYRYLRNALSRDPGVELACLLFQPGLSQVGGGSKDAIKKFPGSIEELSKFDVVFLGDVGIDSGQLTDDDCRLLKELVEYQASGLVFMPGWLGHEMSLEATALGDLLPVVLDQTRPEGTGTCLLYTSPSPRDS